MNLLAYIMMILSAPPDFINDANIDLDYIKQNNQAIFEIMKNLEILSEVNRTNYFTDYQNKSIYLSDLGICSRRFKESAMLPPMSHINSLVLDEKSITPLIRMNYDALNVYENEILLYPYRKIQLGNLQDKLKRNCRILENILHSKNEAYEVYYRRQSLLTLKTILGEQDFMNWNIGDLSPRAYYQEYP